MKLWKWRGEGSQKKEARKVSQKKENRNLSGMEGERKEISHGELIIRHCTNKDTEKKQEK